MNQLTLTDDDFIAGGTRRLCYMHPDKKYCVKLFKPGKGNSSKQQKRELKFYQKLSDDQVPMTMIPEYHGTVETNLGKGYVYDLIRDHDGPVSRKFADCINDEPERRDEYRQIFDQLEDYIFSNLILFYDINVYNIVCRKNPDGSLSPFIIDGLGDVVAIEILNYSKRMLRKKLDRRWLRWKNKLIRKYDWMNS